MVDQNLSREFARDFLERRFEDIRDEAHGGWSALCPLCDGDTRVQIDREPAIQTCPNGHTSGQILEATTPEEDKPDPLERVRSLEGASLTDLELIEIPPPEWLVEGFIEQESFGVLFGAPNAGKTFFAIQLICMAAALKWKVKFIEAEGGLFHLRKRLLRAAAAITGVNKDNINISWCAPLDVSTQAGAGDLVNAIRGYDLAVLDSMAALSGGVSENEEAWGRVSNNLAWARSLASCAMLGLHHATKEAWKPGEIPELRHLRGHGALAGRADFAFAVVPGPAEDGNVVFDLHDLKERESGKPPPRRCRIDMVKHAAHFSIEDIGPAATVLKKTDHEFLGSVENLIHYECSHASGQCMSKARLENIVDARAQRTRKAVDQLEHSTRIVKLRSGCYVRVPPSASSRTGTDDPGRPIPVRPVPPPKGGTGDGTAPSRSFHEVGNDADD